MEGYIFKKNQGLKQRKKDLKQIIINMIEQRVWFE